MGAGIGGPVANRVAFVGVGNMGWPMAANLVRAGFDVTVHDADASRAARFAVEHGARAATSVVDLAGVECVVTMLPTGRDVASALLDGDDGQRLVDVLARGAVVVDMSSADPVGTRLLGEQLASFGIELLDAPVSGGVPRAVDGTLAIMVGGTASVLDRVRPVLAELGNRMFEVGSLGCGHAMKALNNFVAGTAFVAAAEAVLVGERFGLDPTVMMDVMNVSTARCFNTESVIKQHVISREFASGFTLGLLTKDVGIAAELAVAIGHPEPLARDIVERLAAARDHVGAERDHTSAVTYWEMLIDDRV
jgi:3-hydroxyisobutyrate dehydrogenase